MKKLAIACTTVGLLIAIAGMGLWAYAFLNNLDRDRANTVTAGMVTAGLVIAVVAGLVGVDIEDDERRHQLKLERIKAGLPEDG